MIAEPAQELSFSVSPSGKVLRHFASIPHHLSCCLQSLAVSHRWSLTRAVVLSPYSGSSTIFVFWHVRSRVSSRTLRSTIFVFWHVRSRVSSRTTSTIFVFWHVRSRVSSRTLRSTIFMFWHVRSRVSSRTLRSTIFVFWHVRYRVSPRTLSSTVSCSNTCDLVLPVHSGISAKSVGQCDLLSNASVTCQFNVLSQKQHPELLSQKQHPDLLITITYHPTSLDKSDIEVLSPNLHWSCHKTQAYFEWGCSQAVPALGPLFGRHASPASRTTRLRWSCLFFNRRPMIWTGLLIWTNLKSCLPPSVSLPLVPMGCHTVYTVVLDALAPNPSSPPITMPPETHSNDFVFFWII